MDILRNELDEKLQLEFPWLKRSDLEKKKIYEFVEGYNHYENYWFDEVNDGWHQFLLLIRCFVVSF